MALGCHGILQMLLESKGKENGFGTWANWLAWLVQWLCTDSILGKVEVLGLRWSPKSFEDRFLSR